ncbi:uncharacterized protein LOC100842183 isoform X1 [Brachypodium distachyon]|nr:uncharacterized protein LOC100842183 isoform X1 [Brachypodium distachyon]|eukprot:XP_003578557.1 uncharacterized protein LOC100842183 isoform X1 [Brachypodium distachyon]
MGQEGSFEVGDKVFSRSILWIGVGYFDDFASTPLDWGFPIDPLSHHPSPPPPPSPSHHMNIDLPQSSVAAEFQPPPADGDLVSTPSDAGFPIDQLWSSPPLPSYQMNVDPPKSPVAVELQPPPGGDLVPTPVRHVPPPSPSRHMNIDLPQSSLAELSSDAGFPIDQLSSPPPLPSYHMNIDLPRSSLAAELQPPSSGDSVSSTVRPVPPPLPGQTDRPRSAIEEELQAWRLPDLPDVTDVELLLKHLDPACERLPRKYISQPRRRAVVNADLPVKNPQELPGVDRGEGRIGIHYLTDNLKLCFAQNTQLLENGQRKKFTLETPDGYWTLRDSAGERNDIWCIVGFKKTFEFRTKSGTKTKWIMNVYSRVNGSYFVEDDLALCHVFEQDSPGYDPRPKCPTFHEGRCDGLSKVTVHHYQDQRSCPRFIPFTPNPGFLVGDPDPDTSTQRGVPPTADHAESKKRKVGSDVWEYFTKIFARDIKGNVLTFAVCNHCSKVLTGGSSGGTTHLKNHTCACKLKPVLAGRNQKASVSVSSS